MLSFTSRLAKNEVSKARIHVVEAELERTRLEAPFDGIVAEVNGEVGEFVTPSPVGIPTTWILPGLPTGSGSPSTATLACGSFARMAQAHRCCWQG